MEKRPLASSRVKRPLGWSSQAWSVATPARFILTPGLTSRDHETGAIVHVGDIRAQTRQVLENLKLVLAEAGAALADIIKVTVYLRENPQLRDKVHALFGADWAPPSPGVGKLTMAASQYFERGGPVRMVHIGDADYIAITGCAAQDCAGRRGLLLVREGGEQLMARLDEGGFSHHYAYGPGVVGGPAGAAGVLDNALRALERASDGSPFPRPGP